MELVNRFSIFQNYLSFSDVIAKRTKQASENGRGNTKQPILNETKPRISKMRQNRQFCSGRYH